MREIRPVHLHNSGPRVSNLHKGLLYLVLHQPGISDDTRKTLQKELAPDLRTQTFGEATADLVGIWQNQFKNWPDYLPSLSQKVQAQVQKLPPILPGAGRGSGDVDEPTAYVLNWLLKKFGAL